MKDHPNAPAWISAVVAVIVGAIAVWSFASSPTDRMLEDHEDRLRELERLTSRQLSGISTQLKVLTAEVARLRDAAEKRNGTGTDRPAQH